MSPANHPAPAPADRATAWRVARLTAELLAVVAWLEGLGWILEHVAR